MFPFWVCINLGFGFSIFWNSRPIFCFPFSIFWHLFWKMENYRTNGCFARRKYFEIIWEIIMNFHLNTWLSLWEKPEMLSLTLSYISHTIFILFFSGIPKNGEKKFNFLFFCFQIFPEMSKPFNIKISQNLSFKT